MIKNVFIFTLMQLIICKGGKIWSPKRGGFDFQRNIYIDPCKPKKLPILEKKFFVINS